MSWLYPKAREGASDAVTRAGRVIYWALSGVGGFIHAIGFAGSIAMLIDHARQWWLPVVIAAAIGFAVHLVGRGARYILSDE